MSHGARHVLGTVSGILAVPVLGLALPYGAYSLAHGVQEVDPTLRTIGVAALVGSALAIGVLIGSRISPVSSVLPGLALTGAAGALVARPNLLLGVDRPLRIVLDPVVWGASTPTGVALLLLGGVSLLMGSVWPTRWRTAERMPEIPARITPDEQDPAGTGAWLYHPQGSERLL